LALAIGLAGFAGMAAFMLPRLLGMADELIHVVVPGEAELTLEAPGTYTIFHEQRSVVGDRLYVSDNISGLRIVVKSATTGNEIPIAPAAVSRTYTFGSRSGTSAFAFNIAEPGRFRLVAAYDDGLTEPQAVLAIGHDFLAGLMITILGSLAIVFAFMAAAVVLVVGVWRRRKAARPEPT
jgi:hypothetical protein